MVYNKIICMMILCICLSNISFASHYKNYDFNNTDDYTYDTDKIIVENSYAIMNITLLEPYGWWDFNDGTGNILTDKSGNNRDGSLQNMEEEDWIIGKLNYSLLFDGSVEHILFGSIASFERTNVFSFESWVNKTDIASDQVICSKMDTAPTRGWQLSINTNEHLQLSLVNTFPGNRLTVETVTEVNQNEWTYVAFSYDGSSSPDGVHLYINGTEQTKNVISNTLTNTIINTVDFQISGRNGNNIPFTGSIDESALYTLILNQTQISFRYNNSYGTENMSSYFKENVSNISNNIPFEFLSELIGFNETSTYPQNTEIRYHVSSDNGTTWKYWSGSSWDVTDDSYSQSNTYDIINNNIGTLDTSGNFSFRALLNQNGTGFSPILYNIKVTSIDSYPVINIDSITGENELPWLNITETIYVNYTYYDDEGVVDQNCTLLDESLTLIDTFTTNFSFSVDDEGIYTIHCTAVDTIGQTSTDNQTIKIFNKTCGVMIPSDESNSYIRYNPYSEEGSIEKIILYYNYDSVKLDCANATFIWNNTEYNMSENFEYYYIYFDVNQSEDILFNITVSMEENESTRRNFSGRIRVRTPFNISFSIITGEAMNYSKASSWEYVNNDAYIVAFNTSLNCSPWWSLERYDIITENSGCWFHAPYIDGTGTITLWENVTYIFYLIDNTDFNSSWSPPNSLANILNNDVYHAVGYLMSFNLRDAFGSFFGSEYFYPMGNFKPNKDSYTYYVTRTELNLYSWLSEKLIFGLIILGTFIIFFIVSKFTGSIKLASTMAIMFLSLSGVMTFQLVW